MTRCAHQYCRFSARYNYPGETPQFCRGHHQFGMINLRIRKCEYPDCEIRPSFGFEGDQPRYCMKHRNEGMIDVVHKKCEETGCNRISTYGNVGSQARFCSNHGQLRGLVSINQRQYRSENISNNIESVQD
jgi:hypothetical protein